MIKKYHWYFIYLIFIILALTNIFQKLQWSSSTDNIRWEQTENGLMCINSPSDSPIKKGDTLLTINKYIIETNINRERIIKKRKYCRYEIERNGLLNNVGIDIINKHTPFSYYILAFSGILFILLTLNILNANLKQPNHILTPPIFFILNLSFSGILIFSPTGDYNLSDFFFLFLDRLSFLIFPALLLSYSIYFPIKSIVLKKIKPRFLNLIIYLTPVTIMLVSSLFIIKNFRKPIIKILTLTINYFRNISLKYFIVYIFLSLIFFLISGLKLIVKKNQKRFLLPFSGVFISTTCLLINILITPTKNILQAPLNLSLFLLALLPLSLTYFLSQKRFTDIEIIIKKTLAISSIFLFIFGIYLFLGINIEKNKLLGIFWSVTAIITAGLLFKPIEATVQKYFEKIFFKGSFNFKHRLKELIQSLRQERNLSSLSKNFLETINHGFNLKQSSLIIHFKKNVFYSFPEKTKILLSKTFINDLFANDNLIFFHAREFERKYPKDYNVMKDLKYFQFLPLGTKHNLIGLIAFGFNENNKYLTLEDWELMFSISSSLSLSVENAFLYSELETKLNEISLLKEFNENIIENLNLGIVVLSKLNIIRSWNSFMEIKFNIPRKIAINKKALTVLGPKLWKKIHIKKNIVSSLNNEEIKISEKEFIFDIYISPLKNNIGKIIGTIIVFEDVTEKIFIQNQLTTSEKMASLGLLSAGVAHEINTPLTGISSFCQFILDNPNDSENIELISKIQEQVIRANEITKTLLNFSRQKGEQPTEINLNKLIDESISLIAHKLKKKHIKLNRKYNFKSKIYGFSTRLQQLFINLFINASDSIPNSNGIITIIGKEDKKNISIDIIDNGIGIEQQNIRKLFNPFFTTKAPGKGTGLGLSITYNIVKEHYGDIEVKSNSNKGTTFIITLPIKSPLRRIKI